MADHESDFAGTLQIAFRHALSYLHSTEDRHIAATDDVETLRSRLFRPLLDSGMDPKKVIEELAQDAQGGLVGSTSGRFFGWVIGGAIPAALAADWLVAAWDQNATVYACSPAAAAVEEIAGAWLKELLGLPSSASFAFVTGCQMAHSTCLAAARHGLLAERGWDVETEGLFGAPRLRILTSKQRHGTFERAVRLLGIGSSQCVYLESDSEDRLDARALERAFAQEPAAPTIVLLQAGDINVGAFDQFETLIPIAHRYGAWVHVDGAFGLWVAASPRLRHLVNGIQHADSWATDGHKWLNVPYDSGYAFVSRPDVHRASMSYVAPYVAHHAMARDQSDWNPEWSRRARGFSTYAALRQLGRLGVAEMVERCCRHAHELVMRIGALPGAEVLWEPVINQGMVRFLDPVDGAGDEAHDRRTEEVIAAINASGEAFFCATTWRGRRAMRVSVSNWQTSESDVDRTVNAVRKILL
jgi:glutamate/tyrosine decarboxylase-like PLP-dependent enzyme